MVTKTSVSVLKIPIKKFLSRLLRELLSSHPFPSQKIPARNRHLFESGNFKNLACGLAKRCSFEDDIYFKKPTGVFN